MMSTQKPENEKKQLTLNLVFPDRQPETLVCDSLKLTVKDSDKGKNGGLYGIHPGHAPALFLLDTGITEAFSEGNSVMKLKTSSGFAHVENDRVTMMIETADTDH